MSDSAPDPLRNIRYITLQADDSRSVGAFRVRPDVPLPVEIDGDPERAAEKGLSWEAIISAMLKILAYEPG